MKKNGKIAFEESSGNVFADMGLDDADELLTRAKLGHSVQVSRRRKGEALQEVVLA